MRKFSMGRLMLSSVVLLASCGKSPEDLLIGSWRCSGDFRDSATSGSGSFVGTVEYVRNGKSNATIEMSVKEDGLTMILGVAAIGSWSIDDGQLIDSIEGVTPMFAEFGGQRVPGNALPSDAFDSAMAGFSSGSTIQRLDEDVLIISNAGNQTSCTRII